MENRIKMDDLGVPLFLETPISLLCYPLQRSDGQRVEVTDDRTGKLISLPHPVKELRVSGRPTKTCSFVQQFLGESS